MPNNLMDKILSRRNNMQIIITMGVISGMSIIFLLGNYIQNLVLKDYKENAHQSNIFFQPLFKLGFSVIFSKVILRVKLFRQYYISLSLIVLSLFCLNIQNFSLSSFLSTVPCYLLFNFAWSFIFPYSKVIMKRKYIQPNSFGFIWGVWMLFLVGIIYFIIYIIDKKHPYIDEIINLPNDFIALFFDSVSIMMTLLTICLKGLCSFGYISFIMKIQLLNLFSIFFQGFIF